jgi:hypothetical protein
MVMHSSSQELDDLVEGVVGFMVCGFDLGESAAVFVGRCWKRLWARGPHTR